MGENKPLVSVIIPVYNRENVILNALNSVLNQTYDNLEVIVIDDGSDDRTEEYIAGIEDSRVYYIKNGIRSGPGAARNKGVRLAKGEYIAFQDSDDEWREDKIEKQMKVMMDKEEVVDLVYCEIAIYNQESFFMIMPPQDLTYEQKKGDLFSYLLLYPLIGIGMLMRKKKFLEVGGFAECLKSLEDYEFSIRFARNHKIGFVPEPLVRANDTPFSVSKQHKENVRTQAYIIRETFDDMKEKGMLWEKIFIVKRYAALYECQDAFREAMESLTDLFSDEEKVRLAEILSTTLEEDDERINAYKADSYHQLLHIKEQVEKLRGMLLRNSINWFEGLQATLIELMASLDDYEVLFDVTPDIRSSSEEIKRRLSVQIEEREDQIELVTGLRDMISVLYQYIGAER